MLDFEKLPRFHAERFRVLTLIPEWAHAYDVPEEAIIRQLAWAHGWIESNKRRAPKKDVIRFLWNWMAAAKRKGNLVPEDPNPKRFDDTIDLEMSFEEMQEIRRRNFGELRSA